MFNRKILSSKEIKFYKNNGYEIVKKSYILFGEIQHWLMRKECESKFY